MTFDSSSAVPDTEVIIEDIVAGLTDENYLNKNFRMNSWYAVEEEQNTYLIKMLKYLEVHFGFWLTSKNMAELLNSLNDADEYCMILTGLNGSSLIEISGGMERYKEDKGVFAKYLRIER